MNTGTMTYKILRAHNSSGDMNRLKLKFDCLASHDITYVGVIQTAKASGLAEFPVPYVLTNCHNSLCAVGGTINADDHKFGLSAAKKYGGEYVPPHLAVIHQYMREMKAGVGKMILGTDSHTRYGPLGTLAIGEGGGEVVKQLLGRTYDIDYPKVIAIKLEGAPLRGVGPMDVALTLIKRVFVDGIVKNAVLEFIGGGISNLSMDYRLGIDVMTTETTCLSSVWVTDEKTREYLEIHGRGKDYYELKPEAAAKYDDIIEIDLSKIKPMIAMPFHPSFAFTIEEFNADVQGIIEQVENEGRKILGNKNFSLQKNIAGNRFKIDQAVIAGCAGGTYENIAECCEILGNKPIENDELTFSVYPASQPVLARLTEEKYMSRLIKAGAIIRTAFCGPCFGAGDVPANNGVSIRHTTRNFPNREGSKPKDGQIASVILMDSRSIAASVRNGGFVTSACDVAYKTKNFNYKFDSDIYNARVYRGHKKPLAEAELAYGPNIKDWPVIPEMKKNLLMKVCSVIRDEVTTTDELVPSGEASSYRSNPLALAEFTLSRKDPLYLARAKEAAKTAAGSGAFKVGGVTIDSGNTSIGSVVVCKKPGDGSAREQAASCQRVLGGAANIAVSYATKRYRSNLINWGLIPFTVSKEVFETINVDDSIYIEGIKASLESKSDIISAKLISGKSVRDIKLSLVGLSDEESDILLKGCLINYYKN